MLTLPSACWCPPLVCMVVLLNGGSGVRCDAPYSDWVWHLALPCSPLLCPALRCVRCHSIVDLVWCLCGRVVSLWNRGDGLCWGRRARVGGERSVLFLSSSLPLVVGVRGSARAALRARTLSPNTIASFLLSLPLLFYSPLFFALLSFFVFGMAVCVHHVSECSVGMTAMGSLSRSPSFFW